MSDLLNRMLADFHANAEDGRWCPAPDDVPWRGTEAKIRPMTSARIDRLVKLEKAAKGKGSDVSLTRLNEIHLTELLAAVRDIGEEREGRADHALVAELAQIPAYATWVKEQAWAMTNTAREDAAADLGN